MKLKRMRTPLRSQPICQLRIFPVMMKLSVDFSIDSTHHLTLKNQLCLNTQIKLNFVFCDRVLRFSSYFHQLCIPLCIAFRIKFPLTWLCSYCNPKWRTCDGWLNDVIPNEKCSNRVNLTVRLSS